MQLSTRARYAVMAMVELASRKSGEPVALSAIAASQHLSQCYLEQLFLKLRRAGLVASVRGPGGGYRLARPANELAVASIIEAVDENLEATRCPPAVAGCMEAEGTCRQCRTHNLWRELGRQIRYFLADVTLEDVVQDRVAGRATHLARPVLVR